MLAIAAVLVSFKPKPGGEGFEIYLGNKLLTQQFGSKVNETKTFQLSQASYNELLLIKYYHCGKVGKHRVITIRNEENKVVKEFRYSDAANSMQSVAVPVKDLPGLKGRNISLRLFYSSTELPNGRMLAFINVAATNIAGL